MFLVIMGKTKCAVPGCKSGSYSERKRLKLEGKCRTSLFFPPRDADLYEKWREALSIYEFDLCKTDPVCELHFLEDEIERFFITKLTDGSVSKIEKRPVLKSGAIPSIFPNILEYLSHELPKRKISSRQDSVMQTPKEIIVSSISTASYAIELLDEDLPIENISKTNSKAQEQESSAPTVVNSSNAKINLDANDTTETVCRKSVAEKENLTSTCVNASDVTVNMETNFLEENEPVEFFSYEKLLKMVMFVKKPSDFWSITASSKFIICAKWNENYIPERRVVIEKNLKVKVFLGEKEISVTGIMEVTNDNDVTTLLQKVENYSICAGAIDKSMINCKAYLTPKNITPGRKKIWCSECYAKRKRESNNRNRKRKTVLGYEKLRQRLKNTQRKNNRLKRKMENSRRKIMLDKERCSKIKKEAIQDAIAQAQKEAIFACFHAAKLKN